MCDWPCDLSGEEEVDLLGHVTAFATECDACGPELRFDSRRKLDRYIVLELEKLMATIRRSAVLSEEDRDAYDNAILAASNLAGRAYSG